MNEGRLKQTLRLERALSVGLHHGLEQHAFVSRVLVDQIDAVRAFGDQVGRADLTDRPKERNGRGRKGDLSRGSTLPRNCRTILSINPTRQRRPTASHPQIRGGGTRSPSAPRLMVGGRSLTQQRGANHALEDREYPAWIPETNFSLGRMHVDIHALGWEGQEDHHNRVAPNHKK